MHAKYYKFRLVWHRETNLICIYERSGCCTFLFFAAKPNSEMGCELDLKKYNTHGVITEYIKPSLVY